MERSWELADETCRSIEDTCRSGMVDTRRSTCAPQDKEELETEQVK